MPLYPAALFAQTCCCCLLLGSASSVIFRKEVVLAGTTLTKELNFGNLTLEVRHASHSVSLDDAVDRAKKFAAVTERNANGSAQMDVIMVGDHSFFRAFMALHAGKKEESHRAALVYLEAVFLQLRGIYSQFLFFDRLKIDLRLVKVYVIRDELDCPMRAFCTQNGNRTTVKTCNALKAIEELISWRKKHIDSLPGHDQTVFLTKYDLSAGERGSRTLGLARPWMLCTDQSLSLIEDVGGMLTSIIAAHEIGHHLGAAFHDGQNNTCSPADNYLIASSPKYTTNRTLFENGFRLSPCSQEQIEDFLTTPESACLNVQNPGIRSVTKKYAKEEYSGLMAGGKRKMPGEYFDATMQCKLIYGQHSGECPNMQQNYDISDICERLMCVDRRRNRHQICVTQAVLPRMDGTPCGDNEDMWCIRGTCVSKLGVQKKKLECHNLNELYCRQIAPSDAKQRCAYKRFASVCCALCQKYNSKWVQKHLWAKERLYRGGSKLRFDRMTNNETFDGDNKNIV